MSPRQSTATAAPPAPPDLVRLHLCRTQADLDAALAAQVVRLWPKGDFAVMLANGPDLLVRTAAGPTGRWRPGSRLQAAPPEPPCTDLPVRYGIHQLGSLWLDGTIEAAQVPALEEVLAHYGAALANLTFGAEHRTASERYAASLQVFEEGIVLFQESDLETVLARLLSLAVRMAGAQAGALYVLEQAGNPDSQLELRLTHGMPDSLLAGIEALDGGSWPRSFLQRQTAHSTRSDATPLGGLDPETVPGIIDSVVSLPLRYDGIDCGLLVLFNVVVEGDARGDLLERLAIFGRLGAAVLHRFQIEALAANQRSLQRELQIAAAIQERLLPTRAPAISDFDFAWHSLSANNIGGDYLDFALSDLGDLHAIIADASGHGINSALLMSSFRSTWRAEAPWVEPAPLCRVLNSAVEHEVGSTGMFITAATLRIDRNSRRMTVSSAGHNPLFVYRAATGDVQTIDAHGPPLGFSASGEYGSESVTLASGDVLLLYTDGITEAVDADAEMFGDARLVELLRRAAEGSPHDILQAILAELAAFTGRNRYDDDVSLSIVKVR
ncbi:MAG: PP2C family protein-serine/threonine phosphatase [Planctomycetota bacterium]